MPETLNHNLQTLGGLSDPSGSRLAGSEGFLRKQVVPAAAIGCLSLIFFLKKKPPGVETSEGKSLSAATFPVSLLTL